LGYTVLHLEAELVINALPLAVERVREAVELALNQERQLSYARLSLSLTVIFFNNLSLKSRCATLASVHN
jgi:hypothetical protein